MTLRADLLDAGAPVEAPGGSDHAAAPAGRDLLSGGGRLALAMLLASAGNYLLNLLLGRWLSPAAFADANLMVTLMLLVTAVAVTLQLIAAHVVTDRRADLGAGIVRWLERRALVAGVVLALLLAGGAPVLQGWLHTASPWPFVLLGLGMPCYITQAVGRGVLQGHLQLDRLAGTFLVEMVVRVVVGAGLVALGHGVNGATAGLTASFLATWASVRWWCRRPVGTTPSRADRRSVGAYAGAVSILLVGQIIVNNGDVLVAKRFLAPSDAGVYAVIALVGRAVFFLSWSVATTVFPAVARRQAAGLGSAGLRRVAMAIVAAMGALSALFVLVAGDAALGAALGPAYTGQSTRLAAYAVAATLFALVNLEATGELSLRRTGPAWLVVAGGVLQTLLLLVWRRSIPGLIGAQIVAMAILFAAMTLWRRRHPSPAVEAAASTPAVEAAASTPVAADAAPSAEPVPRVVPAQPVPARSPS